MGDWNAIFKDQGRVFFEVQEDMEDVIGLLKKEGVKRVLDLGCGSGRHTRLLAKYGFTVHSTDVSAEGLRLTRDELEKEHLNAELEKTSCYEKFPFGDDFFDAVISIQVIHHSFHDKIKFCISEIERVLKPKGIVFTTVAANKTPSGGTKFKRVAPRTYVPLDGREEGVPHFIYTKKLMREDFKNFQVLRLHEDKGPNWCLLGRLIKKIH